MNLGLKSLEKELKAKKGQRDQQRPLKAIKGQNFKKSLISSIFNVKSLINGNVILKKLVFQKLEIFIFIT